MGGNNECNSTLSSHNESFLLKDNLKKRMAHLSEVLCFTILQALTVTLTLMHVKLWNAWQTCFIFVMPFVLPLLGAKEVNTSGKTFTVKSSLQLLVNRHDDGVAYTCRVDHVALTATHEDTTQVLEVQCEYKWVPTQTNIPWWSKLYCLL